VAERNRARWAAVATGDPLTLGVEEEFLLIDPESGRVVPAVENVLAAAPERGEPLQKELMSSQVETATPPVSSLDELRAALVEARSAAAEAAGRAGVRLLAMGTSALPADPLPPVAENERYARMVEEFGSLAPTPGLCGCHVHVGVADRELGVQVLNHLRVWLPLLQAVTGNSPFYDGRDTAHASWRSVLWARWPTAGPSPHLDSAEQYDRTVRGLIDSGAMFDEGMLYWYARLSGHVPTVEIRLGDVCPTVDDTLLVAALTRALVSTAVDEVRQGLGPRPVPDWLVAAAHWRAGRDGLDGRAVDLRTGRARRAWDLLTELVEYLGPALDRTGDRATVDRLLARLAERGSGARRLRERFARTGDLAGAVRATADATLDPAG
jgi:glutamate---cysteine ligase / carboxylate-amine ligase